MPDITDATSVPTLCPSFDCYLRLVDARLHLSLQPTAWRAPCSRGVNSQRWRPTRPALKCSTAPWRSGPIFLTLVEPHGHDHQGKPWGQHACSTVSDSYIFLVEAAAVFIRVMLVVLHGSELNMKPLHCYTSFRTSTGPGVKALLVC